METSIRGLQTVSRGLFALAIYLVHQTAFALPAYEKVRPLFNNGSISIYPESRHPRSQIRDWCGSRTNGNPLGKLEVVYDGAHSRRDAHFPKGYEVFVDTAVRSVLKQHCSDTNPANVELYFYRRGEMEYLDKVRFQLRDGRGKNTVARVSETMNTAHPSYKIRVAKDELGSCSGKPFCNLTGGIYLNAIYENNEALLISLDQKIMAEFQSGADVKGVQDFVAAISGNFSKDNSNVDIGLKDKSLLKEIATKYMALYGVGTAQNSADDGACLQADSVSITRKYTTPVIKYENAYGIDQGSVGGDTFFTVYRINKEFEPLCNSICSATGVGGSYILELMQGSYKASLVFSGISQVLNEADCNSPEVKQFERNLISLTERSLQRKPTPSAPAKLPLTDVEKARETKRLFTEVMEQQARSETSQRQSIRSPRTRVGTPQTQATASRQGETSRMARISSQAVIDKSVMYDLDGNLKAGEQFLAANKNKDGVIETDSGLQYRIINNGTGRAPETGDQVTAHMRLTLLNGDVIHDTYAEGKPLTFAPYQSIEGFNEGLKLLKAGGKIQLFIPPSLAYGNRAAGEIPAGSTFIYDVELLSID
jgi:FKBP-type peptidyl-prolyl cis-trans isomerase